MSSHHKLSIQHQLAGLLNLSPTDDDDYISEILEQLLSIENPDDVAEYLSNFIVDEGSGDLDSFVKELVRFKSGDQRDSSLSVQAQNESSNRFDAKEPPQQIATASSASRILDEGAVHREEIRRRELEAREKQRDEQERARIKRMNEEEERRRNQDKKRQSQQSVSKWERKSPEVDSSSSAIAGGNTNISKQPAASKQSTAKRSDKKSSLKNVSSSSSSTSKPSKPLKGTPKKVCGCFGNKHPPLTNCLHCGRISCELEGYDYCPFCNNLITQFIPSNKHDSALAHKERLLEYDRTSASRTHVHDDQEDYFVTQTSMWSSTSEREEASVLEEERRRKLHERQKQVLDVKF
ncbi:hypothetical protein HJC23_006236 [Cyclotella cryptica]|uniref:TRIP4/RQT4 C2HC5-type zinc finger domain-containing protein n=1 Tax=Cyclotella cryptica TaxID=29204 RepID=A0ABD3PW04_9STRA|eukprot:CCRYP_010865-RB/>CCRYP_010865-RB protein AED:0.14 eAED:0.14 QI:243/-1/1/1/-1/1/1/129/349